MGAALTYARRYALFTLVGIAGEDDLDAPDLNLKVGPVSANRAADGEDSTGTPAPSTDAGVAGTETVQASDAHGQIGETVSATLAMLASGGAAGPATRRDQSRKRLLARPSRVALSAEDSAALRDRLIADVEDVQSADEAAEWVHKNFERKNKLSDSDAELVEACFRVKLAAIEASTKESEEEHDPVGDRVVECASETGTQSGRAENEIGVVGRSPSKTARLKRSIQRRSSCRQRAERDIDASWPRPSGYVTSSTAGMWRRNPALSAAGFRAKRTTSVSPSRAPSDGRSPTNTPSQSADFTIAKSTDTATNGFLDPPRRPD